MLRWWSAVREALAGAERVTLVVPDPDRGPRLDARIAVGERSRDLHGAFVYRPWRVWLDLAEAVGCRTGTPRLLSRGRVAVPFEPLPEAPAAGYGPGTPFARLRKLEDAASLAALLEALGRAAPPETRRVLLLGAHRGDELEAVAAAIAPVEALDVVAVERDEASVRAGRTRWPSVRWHAADVGDAAWAEAGRFDLAIAIGLLQSPSVDAGGLLRRVVKQHLTPAGGVVVGFPNTRLRDGDWLWGRRTRNVGPVELGVVLRDVVAAKRYLQQQGFRVFVSGKYDLLVTGRRPPRA